MSAVLFYPPRVQVLASPFRLVATIKRQRALSPRFFCSPPPLVSTGPFIPPPRKGRAARFPGHRIIPHRGTMRRCSIQARAMFQPCFQTRATLRQSRYLLCFIRTAPFVGPLHGIQLLLLDPRVNSLDDINFTAKQKFSYSDFKSSYFRLS